MNWFIKRKKPRVVKTTKGYTPQIYSYGWIGIEKNLCAWSSIDNQLEFCTMKTELEASSVLSDYLILTN